MNPHLKVEKLHFEAKITMIKYAFKTESSCINSSMLCSLAFSIKYNSDNSVITPIELKLQFKHPIFAIMVYVDICLDFGLGDSLMEGQTVAVCLRLGFNTIMTAICLLIHFCKGQRLWK